MKYTYIREQSAFADYCARAAKSGAPVAWDTEFMRLGDTYYPDLCVIQLMSESGDAALVDIYGGKLSVAPFLELLADPNVTKIGHALRQDVESLYYYAPTIRVNNMWDTQIAALLCGESDYVGYAYLVEKTCGKKLSKGMQFSDWRKRPLSPRQAEYAMNDVRYVCEIYRAQRAVLSEKNRLGWMEEEAHAAKDELLRQFSGEQCFKKIELSRESMGDAEYLCRLTAAMRWREDRARRMNVGRNAVASDAFLTTLCAGAEDFGLDALIDAENRTGADLDPESQKELACLAPADVSFPLSPKQRRFKPNADAIALLDILLRRVSEETGISAGFIAKKAELAALLENPAESCPFEMGWRNDIFGKQARALCETKLGLAISSGRTTVM
ncbi:MAG: hypothetical protein ABW189_04465 [Rickettsiales bacterium]